MRTPEKAKPSPQPAVRSLKIQPQFRNSPTNDTIVPMIRLTGKWLAELGFKPKKRVKVITAKKKIIIQLEGN